jgi:PAS domain S-box-containing protein
MLRKQQVEASKSEAILESVADGVMVSDGQGEVILFNAAAERILDMQRSDVLDRPTSELTGLYGGGAKRWAAAMAQWIDDPSSYRQGDSLQERIEVGEKIVSVLLSPVTHGDEFLGLVSVFRDITQEVEVDRMKSEFVSTVSHELRTPMTSIKGYADLMLMGATGTLSEEQQHFLDIIKNNADRLSLLVNDLLDISRIEQGRADLEISDVSVAELLNDLMASLEGRFTSEKKVIQITVEIPETLPTVQADYERVTQVFTNIVLNAYQYTPDGGNVAISGHQETEGVRVDVTDTGIGIREEEQERIFERFFRGEDPVVMGTAGTGLGLSIVKHLIDMHQGRVWFVSQYGEGTTFSVLLPYEHGSERQQAQT